MLRITMLTITLMAAGTTQGFAAQPVQNDRVGPFHCFVDTTGTKERTLTGTEKFSEEDLKQGILASKWYNHYKNLKGQIFLSTLPKTAVKSETLEINKCQVRIDSEGYHDDGAKFRLQGGDDTYASVRIAANIEWIYPSQLAKALYLSATSGQRKVVQADQ